MPLLRPDAKPSEPTLEQKQAAVAQRVKRLAQNALQGLVQSHEQMVTAVFKNPRGLTPQQVFDGLCEEAAEAVLLSRKLAAFVNEVAEETKIDTSALPELTLNEDGTVTVAETPEPEKPEKPETPPGPRVRRVR